MHLQLEEETMSNLKPAALPRTKILRKTQLLWEEQNFKKKNVYLHQEL